MQELQREILLPISGQHHQPRRVVNVGAYQYGKPVEKQVRGEENGIVVVIMYHHAMKQHDRNWLNIDHRVVPKLESTEQTWLKG